MGTPDQVAEAMLDYYDLGISTFLIGRFDPPVDAIKYGHESLLRVRELVAAREKRGTQAADDAAYIRPTAPRRIWRRREEDENSPAELQHGMSFHQFIFA